VETARWVLLLLPTTVGMIGFSHAAAPDMPFSSMLTIAMVAAAVVLGLVPQTTAPSSFVSLTSSTSSAAVLFGFSLGLAVLAKGPAAIILCGGGVFFWALFTKRWRDTLRLLHPTPIIAFCVTALPWYILCARRNPDFFRVFIIEHNFKRYLTPEFQHIQPLWFYVPIVALALLPWTVLLLWSASLGTVRLWREKQLSTSAAYFLSYALFTLAFFSISQSKLPGYILPSIPAICLLLARSFVSLTPTHRKSFRLVHLTAAFLLFVLFALTEVATPHFSRGNEKFGIAAGLVLASLGATNLILGCFCPATSRNTLRTPPAFSIFPILIVLILADKLLPSFFYWDPSGRSLARELNLRNIPGNQLLLVNMRRDLHYSLNFYLREEIKDWDRSRLEDGYILTGAKNCRYLVSPTLACEEIPIDLQSTGMFLYRVTSDASAARTPDGGQPQ